MQVLNVHVAKTKLSAILNEVEQDGEVFVICRNGRPIAKLVPHQHTTRLEPHAIMRQIEINYDPTEELSSDEWEAEA